MRPSEAISWVNVPLCVSRCDNYSKAPQDSDRNHSIQPLGRGYSSAPPIAPIVLSNLN